MMNRVLKVSLLASLLIGTVYAQEKLATVESFNGMFLEAKSSGNLRAVYADYAYKESGAVDTFTTAVGGQLKYELASYKGFNAGIAFSTAQDLSFATGDSQTSKNNDEISSAAGNYTQLSEAYINYVSGAFNFRAGRQLIDTPLADSDDIRIVLNTFEAYIATYEVENLTVMAGNLQTWQGTDAGLDDAWVNAGEKGTWFAGVAYGEEINLQLWYYNIAQLTNAIYAEAGYTIGMAEGIELSLNAQYLNETELELSGTEANIYGALVEFFLGDLGVSIAYNQADKKSGKASVSGFGGGTMFTSMDTMIIDEIANDRDARAIVGGLSYAFDTLGFVYAYGNFVGDADGSGNKANIVEQDVGVEFTASENLLFSLFYVMQEDKESSVKTGNDWNRLQAMLNYNF